MKYIQLLFSEIRFTGSLLNDDFPVCKSNCGQKSQGFSVDETEVNQLLIYKLRV